MALGSAFIPAGAQARAVEPIRIGMTISSTGSIALRQLNVSFPYTFMVYASTPQFQAIGSEFKR